MEFDTVEFPIVPTVELLEVELLPDGLVELDAVELLRVLLDRPPEEEDDPCPGTGMDDWRTCEHSC